MDVVRRASGKEFDWGFGDEEPAVLEIPGFLRVSKDGSVERFSYAVHDVPACNEGNGDGAASKDVVLDENTGVWARLYLPPRTPPNSRLPLIVYFHGGGFCMGSAAWSLYHVFLCRLCAQTNCMIISVNYRLAPEHRLPVAYEDSFGALQWLRGQAQSRDNPWLKSHGDFSRCFLAGDSAGGNITHHVAVRALRSDMEPLRILGGILIQPFFGDKNNCRWDPGLPQSWIDVFWKLALPVGANRSHPACNPMDKLSPRMEELELPPLLLCISELDALKDKNMEYYETLKKAGKKVLSVTFKDVGHGFQILDPQSVRIPGMLEHVYEFVNQR